MIHEEVVRDLQTIADYFMEQSGGAVPISLEEAIKIIRNLATKEVEVVRCKDCKHWHSNTEFCGIWSFQNIAQRTLSDDYCSRAERKEE